MQTPGYPVAAICETKPPEGVEPAGTQVFAERSQRPLIQRVALFKLSKSSRALLDNASVRVGLQGDVPAAAIVIAKQLNLKKIQVANNLGPKDFVTTAAVASLGTIPLRFAESFRSEQSDPNQTPSRSTKYLDLIPALGF